MVPRLALRGSIGGLLGSMAEGVEADDGSSFTNVVVWVRLGYKEAGKRLASSAVSGQSGPQQRAGATDTSTAHQSLLASLTWSTARVLAARDGEA